MINPILIISYESLRVYTPYLKNSPIGLLLCDEGHRLKNSGSLLFEKLNSLTVTRRVILSGTPIQVRNKKSKKRKKRKRDSFC